MKTSVKFGLIGGVVLVAYVFLSGSAPSDFSKLSAEDMTRLEILGYGRYLFLILAVFFGLWFYRKEKGGIARYGELVVQGMVISLIVGLFVGCMEFSYMKFINPDFMDQYYKVMLKSLESKHVSQAKINEFKAGFESFSFMKNPAVTGLFYLVETFLIGLLTSLISAAIWRKKAIIS